MSIDEKLDTMDIPIFRKIWQIQANRHWLFRNLSIRNAHNPYFDEVIEELKAIEAEAE